MIGREIGIRGDAAVDHRNGERLREFDQRGDDRAAARAGISVRGVRTVALLLSAFAAIIAFGALRVADGLIAFALLREYTQNEPVLRQITDDLAAENHLFYAVASRPQQRLVLSWHTSDDAGRPVSRSPYVDHVARLFDDRLTIATLRRPLGAVGWGDADQAREAARFAAAAAPRVTEAPLGPVDDPDVLAALAKRKVFSASELEAWAAEPGEYYNQFDGAYGVMAGLELIRALAAAEGNDARASALIIVAVTAVSSVATALSAMETAHRARSTSSAGIAPLDEATVVANRTAVADALGREMEADRAAPAAAPDVASLLVALRVRG